MYQKIIIIGNLGNDPEMRYTPDGTPVTNFNVATNEKWTDKDGQLQKRTTWFKVTAWRKQAETCNQYLTKGQQVLVEGRLRPDPDTGRPRIWTRSDGTPGASYELTAFQVRFLAKPRGVEAEEPSIEEEPPFIGEDEIPF